MQLIMLLIEKIVGLVEDQKLRNDTGVYTGKTN